MESKEESSNDSEPPQMKGFFRLRSSNHNEDTCNNIAEDYRNAKYTDFVFVCGDDALEVMQVHRLILSKASEYFKKVIEAASNISFGFPIIPMIALKEVPHGDLKAIIDFIYEGKITIPKKQLSSVVKTAQFLQVNGLQHLNNSKEGSASPSKTSDQSVSQDSNVISQTKPNIYHPKIDPSIISKLDNRDSPQITLSAPDVVISRTQTPPHMGTTPPTNFAKTPQIPHGYVNTPPITTTTTTTTNATNANPLLTLLVNQPTTQSVKTDIINNRIGQPKLQEQRMVQLTPQLVTITPQSKHELNSKFVNVTHSLVQTKSTSSISILPRPQNRPRILQTNIRSEASLLNNPSKVGQFLRLSGQMPNILYPQYLKIVNNNIPGANIHPVKPAFSNQYNQPITLVLESRNTSAENVHSPIVSSIVTSTTKTYSKTGEKSVKDTSSTVVQEVKPSSVTDNRIEETITQKQNEVINQVEENNDTERSSINESIDLAENKSTDSSEKSKASDSLEISDIPQSSKIVEEELSGVVFDSTIKLNEDSSKKDRPPTVTPTVFRSLKRPISTAKKSTGSSPFKLRISMKSSPCKRLKPDNQLISNQKTEEKCFTDTENGSLEAANKLAKSSANKQSKSATGSASESLLNVEDFKAPEEIWLDL